MKPVIAESVYHRLQNLTDPLSVYLNENLSKANVVKDYDVEKKKSADIFKIYWKKAINKKLYKQLKEFFIKNY